MNKKQETFFCFSPLVMISTFVIELALAAYVLWKYRKTTIGRVSFALLLCLSIFQLAEWMVCEGAFGLSSLDWSRIGFIAIGLLPAFGLHIAHIVAGKEKSVMPVVGYGIAILFGLYFAVVTHGITSAVCGGNYVIFQTLPYVTKAFAVYYYTMLLVGIGYALYWSTGEKNKHTRQALIWFAGGYGIFMVPTAIVNTINPATIAAIPSIMCGFAVVFAFVLTFGILPSHAKANNKLA